MKIIDFKADADIVGRRIKVAWIFEPGESETIADLPRVALRRKLRDFEFQLPAFPDPYLVYDSSAFPPSPVPGAIEVFDLPKWEKKENGERIVFSSISVALVSDGRKLEVIRRTTGTFYDLDEKPVKQWIEILDNGGAPFSLVPGVNYYYQLFVSGGAATANGNNFRSTARPGEGYGLNRKLYNLIPEIFKRHDVVQGPAYAWTESLPEAFPEFGQLRRFIDMFGAALDYMRSSAEGILGLHDIDEVDYRLLPQMSKWIGWRLNEKDSIPIQRNEVKNAAGFYKTVGTIPGLRAVVSRYTGWHTRVAEFAQHIARSNNPSLGNIHAASESGGQWGSTHDSSAILGFGPGNRESFGMGNAPATLTGSFGEPFSLVHEMEFNVSVNGSFQEKLFFYQGDFKDIAHATSEEVAWVMNKCLHGIMAEAVPGNSLKITTNRTGSEAGLRIIPEKSRLVSLENSAEGGLSCFGDNKDRLRIFYETSWDSSRTCSKNRIRYKTFDENVWRDSIEAETGPGSNGNPSAAELPDGRICLCWVQDPYTGRSSLKMNLGSSEKWIPGKNRWDETISWESPMTVGREAGRRYSDPCAITDPFGGVVLFWNEHQDKSWKIKAAHWDERYWAATGSGVSMYNPEGVWTIFTTADGLPNNNVRATAVDSRGFSWFATAGGIGLRRPDGTWSAINTVSGLSSDNTMGLAIDPDSNVWIATDSGVDILDSTGTPIRSLTSADGLAGDNVRDLAIDKDRTAWFATDSGVSRFKNNSWESFDAGGPLPANDVRAAALSTLGDAWFATAAGLVCFTFENKWEVHEETGGPGDIEIRDVSVDSDGSVWAASGSGVFRLKNGKWNLYSMADGLASNDVNCISPGPDGSIWVGTSAGCSRLDREGSWTNFNSGDGLSGNNVVDIHGPWSTPVELVGGLESNRFPRAVLDDSNRIWLIWTRRVGKLSSPEQWLLFYKRFDPAVWTWESEIQITTPDPGLVADSRPSALWKAGGGLKVFFSSDRGGGEKIQMVELDSGGAVTAGPALVFQSSSHESSPEPLLNVDGSLWLFFRSDAGLPLSCIGSKNINNKDSGMNPFIKEIFSESAGDEGSLKRYAGTTTPLIHDPGQSALHRHWGDLLSYTPQKPMADREEPLRSGEFYTGNTLGLYVDRGASGRPLTIENINVLRQLLSEFLPINLRVVIIVNPEILVEYVYSRERDIGESYYDSYPNVDVYTGPDDDSRDFLPDWVIFLSNTIGHVTADPVDLTSLRTRTYFPELK